MSDVVTVFGGSHGLGLATAKILSENGYTVEIVGRDFSLAKGVFAEGSVEGGKVRFIRHDLLTDCLEELFKKVSERPRAVFYTAGIGKLEHFYDTDVSFIRACYAVNTEIPTIIIRNYFSRIFNDDQFRLGCVTSISGQLVSPLFSVYAASKAAISRLIESINVEIQAAGRSNFITDFCPGHFSGSSFSGGETDLSGLTEISRKLVDATFSSTRIFIPDYEDVYLSVINEYHQDRESFGLKSYAHKMKRMQKSE
jgi:short-subunit dehydrogenase